AHIAVFGFKGIERIPAEIALAANDVLGNACRRDKGKRQSGHSGQKGFVHVVLPLHTETRNMASSSRIRHSKTFWQPKRFRLPLLIARALSCGDLRVAQSPWLAKQERKKPIWHR